MARTLNQRWAKSTMGPWCTLVWWLCHDVLFHWPRLWQLLQDTVSFEDNQEKQKGIYFVYAAILPVYTVVWQRPWDPANGLSDAAVQAPPTAGYHVCLLQCWWSFDNNVWASYIKNCWKRIQFASWGTYKCASMLSIRVIHTFAATCHI